MKNPKARSDGKSRARQGEAGKRWQEKKLEYRVSNTGNSYQYLIVVSVTGM